MSNVKTLAPTYVHDRPSNDGVTFRRQHSSARLYPPPYDGSHPPPPPPRSTVTFPTLFPVYRDFCPPTAPVDPQVEYATLDGGRFAAADGTGDAHVRRRPALLPAATAPHEYASLQDRMCRNRFFEQYPYHYAADLVAAEPETYNNLKRPRLSTEPKLHPPHQSLIIDIRDVKKEVVGAYMPQTEAVSPSSTVSTSDRSPKDELLANIKKLEQDISQLESQKTLLTKKQEDLEEAAATCNRPPSNPVATVSDTEPKHRLSIAQRIYAENRKKAHQSNSILEKLGIKLELPLYNQPLDVPTFHENKRKFQDFKKRLFAYFKKRHKERLQREEYLTETYNNLAQAWLKKMERRENNANRRTKEAKLREFFEKQFPELKKQREDRERFSRVGQRIRSDAELEEIMDGLQEQELEDKKMRSLAVVPPAMLDPRQRALRYVSYNGLVTDLELEYKKRQETSVWTEAEKDIFREKFLQHPKAFVLIAAALERKSVADCVQYYYLSKKTENYKQLLRKNNVKRRRPLVKPPTQITTRQQEENSKNSSSIPPVLSSGSLECNGPTSSSDIAAAASSADEQRSLSPSLNKSLPDTDENKKAAAGSGTTAIPTSTTSLTSGDEEKEVARREEAESTPIQTEDQPEDGFCCLCKAPLDHQARPLTRTNCDQLGLKDVTPQMRICPSCRFKPTRRRCEVPTCKQPKRKVKRLRPLPSKWADLPMEVKEPIMKELQITPSVTRCCSACFNRISRKMGNPSAGSESSAGEENWSEADVGALRAALAIHGTKWPELAAAVPPHSVEQCRDFYLRNKHSLGLEALVKEYRQQQKSEGKGGEEDEGEESGGETTSSCEEDNCVERSSSDTTSAPSPSPILAADEVVVEKGKSELAVSATDHGPREEAKSGVDYDSSATMSADENPPEDKFARPAAVIGPPQPAEGSSKEEPTCVRDLIYQAIEMSLQAAPKKAPITPSPPAAHHRPPPPSTVPSPAAEGLLAQYADHIDDYQVQDLSKKSSKQTQEKDVSYTSPKPTHHFARPASEPSVRTFPQLGPLPPPAHFNSRHHELTPHFSDSTNRQDFYPHPSDKVYAQPPHLVAQVPTPGTKTPPLRKSVPPPPPPPSKTCVPPPPPLTKLHYKGSITQGTPNSLRGGAYEGGSITLGTPVQHDLKRNAQVEQLYEKAEHIQRPIVYDSSMIEQYYRHVAPYPSAAPLHAYPGKIPYSNESQLSSKQIMIDFNTSKQMQMRRGGEKESSRASPRSSREHPVTTAYSAVPQGYSSQVYLSTADPRLVPSPETPSQRQNVIQRWVGKSVIQSPRPHDAFSTLVNAAAAQPTLAVPKPESPKSRPVVEGLEKSLLDMHQRPRPYSESTHLNSEQYRIESSRLEPSSERKHLYLQPSSKENTEVHYYEQNAEIEKQKFSAESPHSSLRIASMRDTFSQEQFERQMRQDMIVPRPGHGLAYGKKEDERRKPTKAEEKHYQQLELDNEASRIFSQSFQKDSPKTSANQRGFTAANLIDAIITRQINQNTEGSKSSSDVFNRYRPEQRMPTQPKRKSREEIVTIDDEPSGEKERFSFSHPEQRPGSRGRSPGSAQEAIYNVPFSGASDKSITLGEHIASIISKDYSAPNEVTATQPYFSHSRPLDSTTTSSIHRESPHILAHNNLDSNIVGSHSRSLETLPPENLTADHSSQNCPGKGCIFHSWKLRNALQQSKEVESSFNQDRNIIQTPPASKVSKSPSTIPTPYIVEPISPPSSTPPEQTGQVSDAAWSSSGIPGLHRLYGSSHEEVSNSRAQQPQMQLSPLDYVKNRIVEVMRTQDSTKADDAAKVGSSTMPHLSEEQPMTSNRYLERESVTPQPPPQRFSPYLPPPRPSSATTDRKQLSTPEGSTEGVASSSHWLSDSSRFRSLSPTSSDDQRPRKKLRDSHYQPESTSDKLPVLPESSDRGGPCYVESSSSRGGDKGETSRRGTPEVESSTRSVEEGSRIEPVSPPTQQESSAPPYSLVPNSSTYVSYPYPYSALTVRCLPLPPTSSLQPTAPATVTTVNSSPPNDPPAPLLSSQYEPLSDED